MLCKADSREAASEMAFKLWLLPSASSARLAPAELEEVLNEIHALYDWNPPALIPEEKKRSTSTPSHPPASFEKHFRDKYILKRVQRLPSLVDDLAKNVDTTLNAASITLPPLGFITAKRRVRNRTNFDLTLWQRQM